jgi:hypothetical protein
LVLMVQGVDPEEPVLQLEIGLLLIRFPLGLVEQVAALKLHAARRSGQHPVLHEGAKRGLRDYEVPSLGRVDAVEIPGPFVARQGGAGLAVY